MEKEGIELMMGFEYSIGIRRFDYAYISPTVPENSPIRQLLADKPVKILSNEYISNVMNQSTGIGHNWNHRYPWKDQHHPYIIRNI